MKRALVLFAALLLASVVSHAQTQKGNQTLGLNLGFSYSKASGTAINTFDNSSYYSASKVTGFNIGPNYSYFIADKLDLGASLAYGTNTVNYTPTAYNLNKQSQYNYGGIVYLRKYFMFQDKIGIRTGPSIGYEKSEYKIVYSGANAVSNQENKTDNYNAGIGLDLVYYPSKKLGFSATLANLNYDHYKIVNDTQGHSDGNSVNLNLINNGLSLSVFYAFGN